MKRALVMGAGGFIGSHLVKRLKDEGYWVRGVDKKWPIGVSKSDEFIIGDLRDPLVVCQALTQADCQNFDEVYQLAADMGGAGYIFTGKNDADIMHNSAYININLLSFHDQKYQGFNKVFFSSSACVYPEYNQQNPDDPKTSEGSAYPAQPDSEYGWEKLFSERLYLAFARNYGVDVRIARYHNIFGPEGSWDDGREKAPAALCRKIASVEDEPGEIEIWGDGKQTRSFLYIDECIEGTRRLMDSECIGPVNIGSDEMISINDLAWMIADISGKKIFHRHIEGPLGVRGRNSDNAFIYERLGWQPSGSLREGLEKLYPWIEKQVIRKRNYVR